MDLNPYIYIYILFQNMKTITMLNTWLTEKAAVALDPNAFCQAQFKAGRSVLAWMPFSGF
jgi:hypothetical protein